METPKITKKTTTKKTTTKSATPFVVVDPKDVKRGDTIYIENKPGATPYFVIDMGSPYMLIEDLNTGFGNIYHYRTLYKAK